MLPCKDGHVICAFLPKSDKWQRSEDHDASLLSFEIIIRWLKKNKKTSTHFQDPTDEPALNKEASGQAVRVTVAQQQQRIRDND